MATAPASCSTASLDRLEQLYGRGESITGVPTGYTDLDEQLAGLQPSNLVVVGARPSMGKTAFALGMAAHAASSQAIPVLFFSLEMSHLELAQRMLCAEARVDATRMRNGRLLDGDWPKISHAIGRLGDAPLCIDDNPNLTIMDIRAQGPAAARAATALGLVVVDYLQLMTRPIAAENRQVEVSEISRGLKILARELEMPGRGAAASCREASRARPDKRPMLADLRESGAIEQDADVVHVHLPRRGLQRPSRTDRGTAEIIIAKHRNGPTGVAQLAFVGNYARFGNMARV